MKLPLPPFATFCLCQCQHNKRLFHRKGWVFLLFLLFANNARTQTPQVLKDINPALTLSSQTSSGYNFKDLNGFVYFSADNGINGFELWKTDGTEANTELLTDINPGVGSSNPANLTEMGGLLFFTANNSTNGIELWITDGTAAGTQMVKDIS